MRLTDEDYDALEDHACEFWNDYSDLVNKYIAAVRPDLKDNLKEMLQERSSVYGRRAGPRVKAKEDNAKV